MLGLLAFMDFHLWTPRHKTRSTKGHVDIESFQSCKLSKLGIDEYECLL